MKLFLLPLFVSLCFQSYSQTGKEVLSIACDTASYNIMIASYDKPPVYPNGFVYMMEDINQSIKIHNKFHGQVLVDAHVNCNGNDIYSHIWLENKRRARKRRDSLYLSNIQEVLNQRTWGKWEPAYKDYLPIDSRYGLILSFRKGKVVDIKDFNGRNSLIDYSRGIEQSIPEYDSISVSIKNVVTKETSLSTDTKFTDTILIEKTLSKDQIEKFIRRLKDSESYNNSRSNLYHYNIEFTFYEKNTIKATFRISTLTKNCYFMTEETFIQNYCSIKFGKYIWKLLKKCDMQEFIDESERHLTE